MFWLRYNRWDFADFGGFCYKSGGRTIGRSGGKSVKWLSIALTAPALNPTGSA